MCTCRKLRHSSPYQTAYFAYFKTRIRQAAVLIAFFVQSAGVNVEKDTLLYAGMALASYSS
jgi:hypothetical protein